MTDQSNVHHDSLARYLLRRRDAILASWSARVEDGGDHAELALLSRAEFYDHIPNVLNALHAELRRPDGQEDAAAWQAAIEHGAHRWQQGFDLPQVIRDWGELHRELLREFEHYSAELTQSAKAATEQMALARDVLAQVIHDGIARSVEEYQRLQRVEAGGRVSDIDRVLGSSIQTQFHGDKLVHDDKLDAASRRISGSLGTIQGAAESLAKEHLTPTQTAMLGRIRTASGDMEAMLASIRDLARLEAALEDRAIESFDAAQFLREAVESFQRDHGLTIEYAGSVSLAVRGDRARIQRIVCTIVLDVLRGSSARKMVLRCQADPPRRWSLIVEVFGSDPSAAAAGDLADEIERITREAQANRSAPPGVETGSSAAGAATNSRSDESNAFRGCDDMPHDGPGVGLAIVRRLCELLDATLEIHARAEHGGTFRVLLPRDYQES